MRKLLKKAISIFMAAALSIPVFSVASMGAEAPTVQMPVKLELTGYKPSKAEELEVILTPENGDCPMPEGSVDGKYHLKVAEAGDYKLGAIAFPKLGIYRYTIHLTAGTNAKGTYDGRIYKMTVFVVNDTDGKMKTTVVLHLDGVETKPGEVKFTNNYTGGGGGGGGSTGGGGGGSTPGRPTTVIPEQAPPLSPLETLTGIVEGDIPLAALPQTGTLWWLVQILAVGGVVLLAAGVWKSRRKKYEE
ncbi:MAG: FctA domain-containing protein [Eubacteriales bacterium]|nr:FctA domain-containing protein [Eubacteriales bacterium]